jgi:hypothetical protein
VSRVLADRNFLTTGAVHTFLIRHPRETIISRHALDPAAGRDAYGFESLHEIFTAVCRLTGQVPAVTTTDNLNRKRDSRRESALLSAQRMRLYEPSGFCTKYSVSPPGFPRRCFGRKTP